MNAARECEDLFNDVNDLGSGVAAIGQLLRFSQEEAYPDVIDGIGAVLHHLGKTMQGLNGKFLDGAYRNIREMEAERTEKTEASPSLSPNTATNEQVILLLNLLQNAARERQ